MAGKVLLIVLRCAIGLALISGGLVIEFLQYQPGLMPSVAIGDGIVGPFVSFVGLLVTFWPVVSWFSGVGEKEQAEWGAQSRGDKVSKGDD